MPAVDLTVLASGTPLDVPATGLFLALPLKIAGGTGSPLRVVLLTD